MDTISGYPGDVSWDTVVCGEGVGDELESMMSVDERLEFRDSLRSLREPEV